jgi:hypothetical protein
MTVSGNARRSSARLEVFSLQFGVGCSLAAIRYGRSESSVASFSWMRLPFMAQAALTVMAARKAASLQEDGS